MEQSAWNLRCTAFTVPKQENSHAQNEDATAWDNETGRYAVADGASESIFAGEWAKMLAEAFVAAGPREETFADWLGQTQTSWTAGLSQRTLPWYVEEKLQDGAFATLLGLVLHGSNQDSTRSWSALSVGDCCLFQISGERLKFAFPLTTSAGFGNRPTLISSLKNAAVSLMPAKGSVRPGDQLLLMSDALAQWFLSQHEKMRNPWQEIARLTEARFAGWVEILRKSRQIKNDDVSLLRIETLADDSLR